MTWRYIILLHDTIKLIGRDPVSIYKNSTGVFACDPQINRSIWWSILTSMSRSVGFIPCQTSLFTSTLFTNKACLSCNPIWILYFPRGTSSNIALISANAAYPFALLLEIVFACLALVWIKFQLKFQICSSFPPLLLHPTRQKQKI